MNYSLLKKHYLLLIFIIVIGFGLRFAYLDRPMRFDEAQTVVVYVTKSIPSIFADYSAPNNHIFHNVLVHLVFNYLGESPLFVRLPSFTAGLLIIPMAFVVGTRFYNKPTGLFAASLVATSPILIDFSVNARGYTFIALITLALLYLGHHLQRKDDTKKWLLVSVLSALGFLTIPVMLYPMGVFALWLLVSIIRYNADEARKILFKNYIVSMILGAVLTVVLYTPAIYLSGLDRLINNVNVQAMPLNEFYGQLPSVFGRLWLHISWEVPITLLILLIVGFVSSIIFYRKTSHKTLSLIPFMIVWIMPLLLIQRVDPFPRVWHFLVPIILILCANGVHNLLEWLNIRQYKLRNIDIAVITLSMAVYILWADMIPTSTFTLRAPDAQQGAVTLNELMTPNDRVLMRVPSNYTVFYYSLINDFPLRDNQANSEQSNASIVDDTPSYLYIYYHTGGNANIGELPDLYAVFPDEIDASELLYQWEYSELRRTILQNEE